MRQIWHLITELDRGGAELQLCILLPSLQAKFANRVLCIAGHGLIGKKLEERGILVTYLHGTSAYDVRAWYRLFRRLRQDRPDILVTYLFHADIIGRFIGRLAGITQIICSQRSSYIGHEYVRFVDRMTHQLVTHYTAQTTAARQLLIQQRGIPSNKITVIPNAVQLSTPNRTSQDVRKRLNLGNAAFVIACVSNLKPGKGHSTLLAAFARVQKAHPNMRLLLVGSGKLLPELRRQSSQLLINNRVLFVGSRDDVPDILCASDMFVLPTDGEGMSNALLEAMAAGLPCVTTNISVNREIVTHLHTGFLIPAQNITALTMAIETLHGDPALRSALGKAAAMHTSISHSTETIAKKWESLFVSLL